MPAYRPAIDRFVEKYVVAENGCWLWTARLNAGGYPTFRTERGEPQRNVLAHRWAYEHLIGPIPEGLDVGHKCHDADGQCAGGPTCPHRACVKPDHLQPETRQENTLAGNTIAAAQALMTQCLSGHEFTPENTYVSKEGRRQCRMCNNSATRRRKRLAA